MKTNNNTFKVKSWLPIFPGFYNTIFEYNSEDSDIDYFNELRQEKKLAGIVEFDNIEFDYDSYNNDIAKSCCNTLENELSKFISKIEFENVSSPREYNFRNDSINCTYTLTNENFNNIKTFIKNHLKEFEIYLKNTYTNYDGFISFHSNNSNDWKITKKLLKKNTHNIGSILEFICQVKQITQKSLYYDSEFYMNFLNHENLISKHICNNCNEFIEDSKTIKEIDNFIKSTDKIPEKVKCLNCQ